MSMTLSALPSRTTSTEQGIALPTVDQVTGTARLADALQPGYERVQTDLAALMKGIERGRLNMSEGEKAALQMQVSQFGALMTLAMNVSLGIGKACEKLQQG